MEGVDGSEAVEVDREDDGGAAFGIRIGEDFAQAPGKLMPIGEPGQRIASGHPLPGPSPHVFPQAHDNAGNVAVRVERWPRAEDSRPQRGRRIIANQMVILNHLAIEGVRLDRCQRVTAGLIQFAVAPAGKRRAREPEGAQPRLTRGDVAQIPIEQCHGGRHIADELDHPINWGVELWGHA
ncbi:MAG TPA: hypothetical protein VGS13_08840 [Stellaceae bacterium]|nr:hypothetical protein [Stellaceae bacterium]